MLILTENMIKQKDWSNAIVFGRVFGVLSDPNRLLILKAIGEKEKSVNQIAIELNLSQPLVSHHLAALRSSGLVKVKKTGSFVFYSISTKKIIDLVNGLEEALEEISKNMEATPFTQLPVFFRGRRGRRWM